MVSSDNPANAIVRPYASEDENQAATVWHQAGLAEYKYLPTWQLLGLEQALQIFHDVIVPGGEIWVAAQGADIAGFISLAGSYIDRLYVAPERQNCGIGKLLIEHAKHLRPNGLELHTHQQNIRACAFYENLEFEAVTYGISPPPESAPDVEYHWRPKKNA